MSQRSSRDEDTCNKEQGCPQRQSHQLPQKRRKKSQELMMKKKVENIDDDDENDDVSLSTDDEEIDEGDVSCAAQEPWWE